MSANPSDPRQTQDHSWGFAFGAGSELVGAALAGFLAGQWLDKKLGTAPWLMLVGSLSGITLGLYRLVRAAAQRQNGGTKRR